MATTESTAKLERNNDVDANATVTIASKLPFDIVLRLFDFQTRYDPIMGGGTREYQIATERQTKRFVIQGNSFPQNKGAHQEIYCGFALTRDIPKAFWDEWLSQNKGADYVVNGLIFAATNTNSVKAEAREKEDIVTNLERLNPEKLPRGLSTSDMARRAA